MEEDLRVPQVGNPWCTQWRLQRWGSARVFDYCLYCRTRACLLCMFVPPTTSLIKVVNSGSLHWALSVFIYFRFTLTFGVNFAGDLNKNLSVAAVLSNTFARAFLALIRQNPSCLVQLSIFPNLMHIRLNVFLKQWICIEHFEFQSNGCFAFKNNFKRTINCLVTRANMNESSTQRINWRYNGSVTCVTQQSTSFHDNFSLIVAQPTTLSNDGDNQNESK